MKSFFSLSGKLKRWKTGEIEGRQMYKQRCGHCHACCQFQREWCVFRRQLVSLSQKTWIEERGRARGSDLHLWIFMLWVHTDFSPHFLRSFREVVGGEVSTWWPAHTRVQACMSVRRHAQILAHAFSASIGNKGEKRKEIRKGNMSSLEWRVVNVMKSKKNAFKKNRKCKKQTRTQTPSWKLCDWALKHTDNRAQFKGK